MATTDLTRYAQNDQQMPLLRALSLPETLERFELACGRNPGDLLINIYNAATALPLIYSCVPDTVINAALDAAVLKLSLSKSLGLACILPFKKNFKVGSEWKNEYRAQFLIMVRGVKDLAMRTNRYRRLNDFKLYEGQDITIDQITGASSLIGVRISDKVVGYGAYMMLTNGYEHAVYWKTEKVLEHGKLYSPTYDKDKGIFKSGSRWLTHFDEQGSKTVVKDLILNHGVISDTDRSNLTRIESKSEGDIVDGEVLEQPRIEEPASIALNSEPEPAPAVIKAESEEILVAWTPERIQYLIDAKLAQNTNNAKNMLALSILPFDATKEQIERWGTLYRAHRDDTSAGPRTPQMSAEYANRLTN